MTRKEWQELVEATNKLRRECHPQSGDLQSRQMKIAKIAENQKKIDMMMKSLSAEWERDANLSELRVSECITIPKRVFHELALGWESGHTRQEHLELAWEREDHAALLAIKLVFGENEPEKTATHPLALDTTLRESDIVVVKESDGTERLATVVKEPWEVTSNVWLIGLDIGERHLSRVSLDRRGNC